VSASRDAGRSTANRLLAVLAVFESGTPSMRLSTISAISGLSMATTYRLTGELVQWGAIEKNLDGTFQVGTRLWKLGAHAPRLRELRETARPVLTHLHEATGETVQLAVAENDHALCIDKIAGSRSTFNVTEVAGPLPLHATAVGKVILAFSEHAQTEATRLRRFTARTIVDPGVLRDVVDTARLQRVAYSREEMTRGTASVAAPIFDETGRFRASLGILAASSTNLARLVPMVHSAASSVSGRLGHRGDK
jgi:DNA-binding IclR family transcriptional regulator